MRIFISAVAVFLATTSSPSEAEYNSNFVARITSVLTYDDGHFLIALDRMPAGPCSSYFIVSGDVPIDARQMLLSRSLLAKSTGESINIGYDGQTCVNGWYRTHRIG